MNLRILCGFAIFTLSNIQSTLTENELIKILNDYNQEEIKYCNLNENAEWDVQTNVGDEEIQKKFEKISSEYADFQKKHWTNVWSQVQIDENWNESTVRQLVALKQLGSAALNESDFLELLTLTSTMLRLYSQATICPYKQPNCTADEALTLDPEIEQIMAHSVDYDELAYVWNEWRDKSGKLMRNDYKKYVQIMNAAARANEFEDTSKWWQSKYEDENFVENVDQLWTEIEPLYNELHTYVKYQLFEIYGNKMNYSNPNIPAHLLGNMWAQSWNNLYDMTKPFPNASLIDVTKKLQDLGYDSKKMFEVSDEFYLSMGLINNQVSYTGKAIIDKPTNRTIVCQGSAWDFCNGDDFRIKMCTKINMKDFITIHHEMGHIQYFLQYRDLPLALRAGANPGFHEAVGDTIALAVATPQHLQKIGLLDDYAVTEEDNINALYSMALKRLVFLPFSLMIDKWRWDVFSGHVEEKDWNKHWWMLREKYQKVSPPFQRNENDFDPGAKYHVPANSPYIAYFVARVLQFQMYQSLCKEAGEYPVKALHKCDFYNSHAAGTKLSDGLKLGSSKHWSAALYALTGSSHLSAASLLEYFKPLYEFLKEKNSELIEEHEVRLALETYNTNASKLCNDLVNAEWDAVTDLASTEKEQAYIQAAEKNAEFKKTQYHTLIKPLIGQQFSDAKIQRQIKLLSSLGTDILDDNSLNNLTGIVLKMVQVYNMAKVCPYDNQMCDLNVDGMNLDPDVTNKMASSTNYDELKYFWQQWYDNAGKPIRNHYNLYVPLMNKAAELDGFKDASEMWQSSYEDSNFGQKINKLWEELQPLYDQLHKYVVRKLSKIYPEKIQSNDTHLPAHVLGNMWAQSWDHLYEKMKPFNASDLDVTTNMKKQNYTAMKIFEMANEFYQSLGMPSAKMSYTGNAIIERPDDRLMVCHPQAYDFCDGKDFRIRMCTKISQSNFKTAHHEMGHIEYFTLYKDQPIPFRNGANPGFHEAIGDTIALSVNTPTHLEKIGLLKDYENSDEDIINFLFKTALKRVAFLPFSLLIDIYRWDIFSGKVNESNWNKHWEYLREKYQKIKSPVQRDETNFDAGGKIHVAANGQYINYFFSHIFEYQLHKSLCISANKYQPNVKNSKPLSQCDIYQSKAAGDKLIAGLKMGQSIHWSDTLELLTGDRELKADALLEYYNPLMKYLLKVNQEEIL